MSCIGNRVEEERAVLSTILLEPDAYRNLPEGFAESAFEVPEYRDLFGKIMLSIRAGLPVDATELGGIFDLADLIESITHPPIRLDGRLRDQALLLTDHGRIARSLRTEELVRPTNFQPLNSHELREILGLTIKEDNDNKLVTFLAHLSAFTEDSQLNISFNAPSSTGKSYIPLQVGRLFPREDVIEVGYCSPTAFFHDAGSYNRETNTILVDLSRKVLIFLDQPHDQLLQHLRPILSHDQKEILLKITDKSQKAGLRTKNILLRGFPSVTFCTAGLNVDEQEATRFLLLSPEVSQVKIRAGISEKIIRETDARAYFERIDANPGRRMLMERIRAIKQEVITDIRISSEGMVREMFFAKTQILKPRHQRDIGRVLGLVKTFALLNLWFRERHDSTIVANEDDIREAFALWDRIAPSQELNIPPYVYKFYTEIILAAYERKRSDPRHLTAEKTAISGLSRKDIMRIHLEVYGRPLADWSLRQQIIPMLESSGLILQEPDPENKRRMLIYPTASLTTSQNSE